MMKLISQNVFMMEGIVAKIQYGMIYVQNVNAYEKLPTIIWPDV